MLTNALPKLINLRNVHISASTEGILPVLRMLQICTPRLRGLSLESVYRRQNICLVSQVPRSPDAQTDLGFLEFKHLAHFSYSTNGGANNQAQTFLAQNRDFLRTVYIVNHTWAFPTNSLSIRNLTHIHFIGAIPTNSQIFADILTNGRQLESLTLGGMVDCVGSSQFRSLQSALPFLRHFSFSVHVVNRRAVDRDLFPAIAEFLRGRQKLRTLELTAFDEHVQRAVGFDASVWGVLPSLTNLKGLTITYPADLSPGLASWLIPRSVLTLALTLDHIPSATRDPMSFLDVRLS